MGIRSTTGKAARAALGDDRTQAIVRRERSLREALARRIEPPRPSTGPESAPGIPTVGLTSTKPSSPAWIPSDPFATFPDSEMSRHELLSGLHRVLSPRTYFEIGVNTGASMKLSSARSVGVDPALDRVKHTFGEEVQLVGAKSDEFFSSDSPLSHLGGVDIDLAFIDGMHLSEFALRDFINTEPFMARAGVVVLDDMLPRNVLEAARDRRTSLWAGDVYKVAMILMRNRPDLTVILVNTHPTGTVVVVGLDPKSAVLDAAYDSELSFCIEPDPQRVPEEFMDRSAAVNAKELLDSPAWSELVAMRQSGNFDNLSEVLEMLTGTPRGR